LRSTGFSLRPLLATASASAAVVLVVGCSTSMTTSADLGAAGAPPENAPAAEYDGTKNSVSGEDAGTQSSATYLGNPLCRVDTSSCMPDDDSSRATAGALRCEHGGATEADGGAPGARDDEPFEGCRVGRAGPGTLRPACEPAAREGGADGARCDSGADCAPGFDCVQGEKENTCRHYCCSGGCKAQTSQNGGATFCDVQRLVDVAHNVPVCMPLKRCKLLAHGECASGETCAIVNDTGDTGCVAVGDKQVGDSCDADHCAAGLTCIGQPGARKCQALCKVGSTTCGPNKACKTSAIFKDSSVGICKDL